jgi:hypothetical protein
MVTIRFILTVAETERMKYYARTEVSRIAIALSWLYTQSRSSGQGNWPHTTHV